MRQSAIVLSHYSQHAPLGLSLSGRVSNPLPCVACRGFARHGANLSSKQMKMDSAATADTKCHESELTFLHYLHAQSQGKKRKRKKKFLLIAAVPDTHMIWSAISCSVLGRVMRLYYCIYTFTEGHTNTLMHAYKAECLLANELPW